jgi:hypothetical protein
MCGFATNKIAKYNCTLYCWGFQIFLSATQKRDFVFLATIKLLFLALMVILNGTIFFLAKFGDHFSKVGDPENGRDP